MEPLATRTTHAVLADVPTDVVLGEIRSLHWQGQWSDGIPTWAQKISDLTFGVPDEGSWTRKFEMLYVEKQLLMWLIDKAYEETA